MDNVPSKPDTDKPADLTPCHPLHGTFNGVEVVGIPFEGKLWFPLSCLEKGLEYPEWGLTKQLARWLKKGLIRLSVHMEKFANGRLDTLKVVGGDYFAKCEVVDRAPHRWMLTEAGIYRILMLSKRAQAIAFQDWLEQDLLPTLNRTGTYTLAAPPAPPPEPPKAFPAVRGRPDEEEFKAKIIGRTWAMMTRWPLADVAEVFALVERKAIALG